MGAVVVGGVDAVKPLLPSSIPDICAAGHISGEVVSVVHFLLTQG